MVPHIWSATFAVLSEMESAKRKKKKPGGGGEVKELICLWRTGENSSGLATVCLEACVCACVRASATQGRGERKFSVLFEVEQCPPVALFRFAAV